jgi:hypothetical protein
MPATTKRKPSDAKRQVDLIFQVVREIEDDEFLDELVSALVNRRGMDAVLDSLNDPHPTPQKFWSVLPRHPLDSGPAASGMYFFRTGGLQEHYNQPLQTGSSS